MLSKISFHQVFFTICFFVWSFSIAQYEYSKGSVHFKDGEVLAGWVKIPMYTRNGVNGTERAFFKASLEGAVQKCKAKEVAKIVFDSLGNEPFVYVYKILANRTHPSLFKEEFTEGKAKLYSRQITYDTDTYIISSAFGLIGYGIYALAVGNLNEKRYDVRSNDEYYVQVGSKKYVLPLGIANRGADYFRRKARSCFKDCKVLKEELKTTKYTLKDVFLVVAKYNACGE